MEILDQINKYHVRELVANNQRLDGRGPFDFRPITIEKGVFTSTEGSARVSLGKTQVIAGVKIVEGKPFPDRPEEGVLSINAELLPLASPTFESGPPSEDSIELARVVDRGIRGSETIDIKSFFIEPEKVWCLFIDLYVLDYDGNLFDASSLAAMAALTDAKVPRYEEGKVVRADMKPLKLGPKVVTCTFAKIGGTFLLDPKYEEEIAMDGRLTIATTPDRVCASQKGGGGSLTKEDILSLVDKSFEKGNELRSLI
ncbi:MAG: exosome complex protein Rrp42 [Candidatus Micrarchaeota archaeon]|nr:exosome complex protein Rrp42 [Candidatus Micrarchaeota archaeon]